LEGRCCPQYVSVAILRLARATVCLAFATAQACLAEAFEVDVAVKPSAFGSPNFSADLAVPSVDSTLVFRLKRVPPDSTRITMLDVAKSGGVFRLADAAETRFAVPPVNPLRGMQRLIDLPLARLKGLQPGRPSEHRVWFVGVGGRSVASNAVIIRYQPPAQDARGPHRVRILLDRFRAVKAQEDGAFSDGDEPYLLAFLHVLDGPQYRPDQPREAVVRSAWQTGATGNLAAKRVRSGVARDVPPALSAEAALTPVSSDRLADAQKNTLVVLTVFWLEEDATPTSESPSLMLLLEGGIRFYIEERVRSVPPGENPERLRETVQAAAEPLLRNFGTSASVETNPFKRWASLADPDDLIGVATIVVSLEQLVLAGDRGVPIDMVFRGDGAHYELYGRILHFPPR